MASNAQGEGASSGSSSKRGRKSGGKAKVPKIKQRGMGIAQLEQLRIQNQIRIQNQMVAAASTANAAAGSFVVPTNLHNVPVYQLLDGLRVINPVFLSSRLAPIPEGPQGVKEETCHKNKKARTDSWDDGSAAAAGSSSSEEPNLELRLFF